MTKTRFVRLAAAVAGLGTLFTASLPPGARQPQPGPSDIAGVVTGPRGPEAGVWVIAETNELPTRFVRIVVTDDQGSIPHTRFAEGYLRRLGPRLRAGRFTKV